MKFGVGQPVPRLEDPRLVTGAGVFTDDVNLPGQLYLAMARSRAVRPVVTVLLPFQIEIPVLTSIILE